MITSKMNSPYLEALARLAARLDARMEDAPAAPADPGDGGGEIIATVPKPDPIKEAGKAFLAGLTEEQLESEVGTIEDGEIATIAAEGKPKRKSTPRPGKPAATPKPKPGATTPRAKDGKFAESGTVAVDEPAVEEISDAELEELSDAELDALIAGNAAPATPAEPKADEQDPDAAAAAEDDADADIVVLRGLADRGEEDIELEIDDPAVVERIRRLENDGLRRAEYNERLQAVEARDSELAHLEATWEANPVGAILGLIVPERQLEVARALLAEHFDALAPTIEEFFDKPDAVPRAQLKARDEAKANDGKAAQKIAARNQARAIERSVRELIPETVDRQVAARFMRDAERDLLDAVSSGERVSPATAAILLKDRIRMYGFDADKAQGTKDLAGARPLSDRAKALADRRSKAAERQNRIKRVQAARRNASAIAPAGAGSGGTSVREPLVPKDATIGEASRAIRSKGITSWADINRG